MTQDKEIILGDCLYCKKTLQAKQKAFCCQPHYWAWYRFSPGDMVTFRGSDTTTSITLWMETGEVDEDSKRGGSVETGQLATVLATHSFRGYEEIFILCTTGMGWQVEDGFKKAGA